MKKNLIQGNPVLDILGFDQPAEQSAPPTNTEKTADSQEKTPVPTEKKPRESSSKRTKKADFSDVFEAIPNDNKAKKETKSKRLNLLLKPSTLSEITKLAQKYGVSVNDFINRILESFLKNDD